MRFASFYLVAMFASVAAFACSATPPPASQAPLATASAQSVAPTVTAAPPIMPEAAATQTSAKVPVSGADPQWGNVDAPVTIVEFSDFQCPFCSRVVATLEQLQGLYGPEKLRLVFKHNPLPFHESAQPTAEAATAVQMLGGSRSFFVFHDLAFDDQPTLTGENFNSWASQAGVPAAALKAILASGRPARKVSEDMALAAAIGATGTPSFFINGVKVAGAQPLEKFVEVIDAQLVAAAALTRAGTKGGQLYATLTNENFVEPAPPEKHDEPDDDSNEVWNVAIAADDPVLGANDALVTIVMFSEFQCPFCKRVEGTLADLRAAYGQDLRIVWKDNPLSFHPRALPAAQLARFVYETKGNEAFWKLHDALFANQPALEESDFQEIAKAQGLAWPPLRAALGSAKLKGRILDSVEQSEDLNARGTPHFFINGRRISGAQPLENFKELIDQELAKTRALVEHGTPRGKVYAELTKHGAGPTSPDERHIDLRPDAPSRGNAHAPVVVQIFSDFQCPFCKRVEPTLSELVAEFKGSLRIVWRQYPLPFHRDAQVAAEASEEVFAQKGASAFWKYHDLLFAAQATDDGLSRENLAILAKTLGVNGARFEAALDDHVHAAKVKADVDAAVGAGLNGTPAFTINDYFVSGAQSLSRFRKLVRLALKDESRKGGVR